MILLLTHIHIRMITDVIRRYIGLDIYMHIFIDISFYIYDQLNMILLNLSKRTRPPYIYGC